MLTISLNSKKEHLIKKSKFIGFSFSVCSEKEANKIISEYKIKFSDANHVCYGYVLGNNQEKMKFSDAKEPKGTAGKQIITIINLMNITNILIIVIRYFGGIKLGVSNLSREYRNISKELISISRPIQQEECIKYKTIRFLIKDQKIINKVIPNVKIISKKYHTNFVEYKFVDDFDCSSINVLLIK